MEQEPLSRKIEKKMARIAKDIEEDAFRRSEEALPHNTHEYARQLLELFKANRLEELYPVFANDTFKEYAWEAGRLAEEPFRSLKNLALSGFLLFCYYLQAEYPMEYEKVTTMGDAGVREIERAKTPEEVGLSFVAASQLMRNYFLAGEQHKSYHPMVKRLKDYIYQNLHQPIQIGNIAKMLGTSPSYLSQVFRKSEGMTIQRFIRKERLERGKKLLAFSDRPIEEISHTLGFSTTSYFGKCLKADTGLTPGQYREKFNQSYREQMKNAN